EKVYEELCEIYGTKSTIDAPIMYEDLQYMRYLDGVIKETMRIFPIVPLVGRKATKDIKIGDKTILKGANIIVAIFHIHRNDKYWPNPLKFDPERFLREDIKHSQYYIPFSVGSRNCIGMKYAAISTKVILATLIRTFSFKVNKKIKLENIKLKFDIVLSTETPLKVRIEKRI
ncbi:PREDICTED: cytochrome P450 4C1-like, partial [Vollenhovia emeryi]|uniref:cytochrome P450 4C1-like n=1 Tax=Vollenhovia emeryi TaxID=411798 RepID=UPI0005F54835